MEMFNNSQSNPEVQVIQQQVSLYMWLYKTDLCIDVAYLGPSSQV